MLMTSNVSQRSRNIFYLSGLLAFCLYLFFLLLLIVYIKSHDIKQFNASSNKVTVLELDIISSNSPNVDKTPLLRKKSQKTVPEQSIVKKSASFSKHKRTDLKSLFSSVKTDVHKVSSQTITNVKKNSISSRFKSEFQKESKRQNITLSNLLDKVQTRSTIKITNESDIENDEYYSRVYKLLSTRWNPLLNVDGLSAKVLIIIYNNGRFDYRFLQNSYNQQFDRALKHFLDKQVEEQYPSHNRGLKQEIAVTFTTKKGNL